MMTMMMLMMISNYLMVVTVGFYQSWCFKLIFADELAD